MEADLDYLRISSKKAVLILVTYGGLANVAYRVARYLQTVYDEDVVAFIPVQCKSAGTLLVIVTAAADAGASMERKKREGYF